MMRRANNDIWSFIYKPLCVVIMLCGLFSLVWLRSSVVTIAYDLRTLEEKKLESLKDMKMLLADRSRVISLANIGSSFEKKGKGDYKYVSGGFVFPDRVKVIHVKGRKGPEAYKASLEIKK
jgi:hypothetical protein